MFNIITKLMHRETSEERLERLAPALTQYRQRIAKAHAHEAIKCEIGDCTEPAEFGYINPDINACANHARLQRFGAVSRMLNHRESYGFPPRTLTWSN